MESVEHTLATPKTAVWRALWAYSRPHKVALLLGGLLSLLASDRRTG